MGKRYLHEALQNASLDLMQYYSVEDIALLIENTSVIPLETTKVAIRKNLRVFAKRNIPEKFRSGSSREAVYLGGAWLYPVNHTYPHFLSELRELHRQSQTCSQSPEKGEVVPVVLQLKYRSRKIAVLLPLLGALGLLIAAYKLDGFQRFSRTPPSEYTSLYADSEALTTKDRYYRAESLFFEGDIQKAQQEAISILNQRNLSSEEAGDAYSLLAKIMGRNGNFNAAIGMLDLADREYASSENEFIANYNMGRRRNLRSFRASLNYQSEDYEKGLSELLPLYEIESKTGEAVHQGYIALMVADGLFWLGRAQEALVWNKRAAKHYRAAGDVTGTANASLNEAWLLATLGRYEKARLKYEKASKMVREIEWNTALPYLEVIKALINKCHVRVEDYNFTNDHPELQRYVRFVKDHPCDNTERVVVNSPPPQGGNDRPPGNPPSRSTQPYDTQEIEINRDLVGPDNPAPPGGDDPPPNDER